MDLSLYALFYSDQIWHSNVAYGHVSKGSDMACAVCFMGVRASTPSYWELLCIPTMYETNQICMMIKLDERKIFTKSTIPRLALAKCFVMHMLL